MVATGYKSLYNNHNSKKYGEYTYFFLEQIFGSCLYKYVCIVFDCIHFYKHNIPLNYTNYNEQISRGGVEHTPCTMYINSYVFDYNLKLDTKKPGRIHF